MIKVENLRKVFRSEDIEIETYDKKEKDYMK